MFVFTEHPLTRDAVKWMENNFECDSLEIRISLKTGFAQGFTKISIRINIDLSERIGRHCMSHVVLISADDTTVIRYVNKWQQINYD